MEGIMPDTKQKEYTYEAKLGIVREALMTTMLRKDFAQKLGLRVSTINYWVKMYRDRIPDKPTDPKRKPRAARHTLVENSNREVTVYKDTEKALKALQDDLAVMQAQKDQLEHEVHVAREKIASLQKVVMVLGHQMDD